MKSALRLSGMWPTSRKNAIISRSRYVGQHGNLTSRKRRHEEIKSDQPYQPTIPEHANKRPETNYEAAMLIKEVTTYIQETFRPTFPAAYKEGLKAAHKLLLKADHQESQLVNLEACVAEQRMPCSKARKTAHTSGVINIGLWKSKISEIERLENTKAISKAKRQIQIATNKARRLLVATGVQARKNKKEYLKGCGPLPPNQVILASFREPDKDDSCRIMEEDSSLCPPPDLQQALDLLIEEREPRWPPEGDSGDVELLLGTQYIDSVASPFDSECEGDDLDQAHLRAYAESLAGSIRSTSPLDHTAKFIRILGSNDEI